MNRDILHSDAAAVAHRFAGSAPRCAMILGSGWGGGVDRLAVLQSLEYSDVPCLGSTQVQGHSGRLHLARAHGLQVLIFQGRRHWYEGAGWEPVAFPVYLSAMLGIEALILTNAAGGIRPDLRPGDLMAIDDHINAMGANPLAGPHDPVFGPRFPDQTEVYDAGLRRLIDHAARAIGHKIRHGVYLAAPGPAYETPAEIAAFRSMGADAVGMSTVPEAMLANAAGLRVAAISCITNMAAGIGGTRLSHREVIAETEKARPVMCELLDRLILALAKTMT